MALEELGLAILNFVSSVIRVQKMFLQILDNTWSLDATVRAFVLATNIYLLYSKGDMLSAATAHIRT